MSKNNYCEVCKTEDKDGQEYKSCNTVCCICRNAFMEDEDVNHRNIRYEAVISTIERDGIEIYEQKYIKTVDNTLVCIHNCEGVN
jgi:hypothetical protein